MSCKLFKNGWDSYREFEKEVQELFKKYDITIDDIGIKSDILARTLQGKMKRSFITISGTTNEYFIKNENEVL